MDFIKFPREKLVIDEVTNLVVAPSCGAISVFMGTTRDNFEGKCVVNLEYEAYESMAQKAVEKICVELRTHWPNVENIAIYHRLGVVPIKEASVIIAVSSPHRKDSIEATEWCINNIKKSVPIWKKEVYSNSEAIWKENKECAWSTTAQTYSPKHKKLKFEFKQEVKVPYVPPHLIQIKATNEELNNRIEKFMTRKRAEIDEHNITEFFPPNRNYEYSCARTDAQLYKRKDSKSHLEVKRVFNSYQNRDQKSSNYLMKYIPPNGIEERLQNLECQLSLNTAVPKNVYKRLKLLEDRLLLLESTSPEYIQFWDKAAVPNKPTKKKIFSLEEIDDLILEAEKKTFKHS
ncbi:molybdopterin synthase catalytic subunit [Cylas formicarius]|uniref:molybdopterin synthase catalytic subunit n=1 Tax=Cylas formicarius TaxID=197179 RepID=UPI002958BF00|nr:molybdopterin synthase catalytic subunit [Cylas formicarius]